MRFLVIFIGLVIFQPVAKGTENDSTAIYVVSISWHTGIVIPAESLPESIWPENQSMAENKYLEIGWGDADFYQDEGFNLWYAFKAIFWPTRSVVHVNPINSEIANYYQETKVVEIMLDQEALEALTDFIIRHLEHDGESQLVVAGDGIYTDSKFYKGTSRYYFPNNSNVWAARALRETGFSISPIFYQFTGWVLNKVENFGKVIEAD